MVCEVFIVIRMVVMVIMIMEMMLMILLLVLKVLDKEFGRVIFIGVKSFCRLVDSFDLMKVRVMKYLVNRV